MIPFPIEKYTTNSGLAVYVLRCRMYRSMVGRVHVIPDLKTVIDTGSEDVQSRQDILAGFDELNRSFGVAIRPDEITRVLLTHSHVDHLGGTPLFTQPNVERCLNVNDVPMAENPQKYFADALVNLQRFFDLTKTPPGQQPRLRQAFLGMGPRTVGYTIQRPLRDGDQVGPFTVHETPGHTKGQSVFQLDEALFTGDHILSQTMAPIWPKVFSPLMGFENYFHGLDKVGKLVKSGVTTAFLPSHEQTIVEPQRRIDMIRAAQQRRFQKICQILNISDVDSVRGTRLIAHGYELAQKIYVAPTDFFAYVGLLDIGARLEYLSERN